MYLIQSKTTIKKFHTVHGSAALSEDEHRIEKRQNDYRNGQPTAEDSLAPPSVQNELQLWLHGRAGEFRSPCKFCNPSAEHRAMS
jgi:hypothetical protein